MKRPYSNYNLKTIRKKKVRGGLKITEWCETLLQRLQVIVFFVVVVFTQRRPHGALIKIPTLTQKCLQLPRFNQLHLHVASSKGGLGVVPETVGQKFQRRKKKFRLLICNTKIWRLRWQILQKSCLHGYLSFQPPPASGILFNF